jgi:hypothetical protein
LQYQYFTQILRLSFEEMAVDVGAGLVPALNLVGDHKSLRPGARKRGPGDRPYTSAEPQIQNGIDRPGPVLLHAGRARLFHDGSPAHDLRFDEGL